MKTTMVSILLLLSWLVSAFPAGAEESLHPVSLYLKANEFYQSGDYEAARDQYNRILDLGTRNGKVYYNLGNTYFRLGQTGKAIQHYLLAREFDPRNEDLEANLGYARDETEDQFDTPSGSIFKEIFFWYDRMTIQEMTYAFLLCSLLFWGALTTRLFLKRPALKWIALIALLVGLTLGGTGLTRMILTDLHKPAVIVVPEAPVQSGMDPESTTLFVLHEGAEVTVEETRQDWRLIRLPTGKKGWVKSDQIGMAVPDEN